MTLAPFLFLLTLAGGAVVPTGEVEDVVRGALEVALDPDGAVRVDADLPGVQRALERAVAQDRAVAVPLLIGMLEEGVLPPTGGAEAGDAVLLPSELEQVLLGALWAQPVSSLVPHLESIAANDGSDAARVTGMRVLAGVGRASEVELLVHLASPPAGETSVPVVRRDAFEQALTEMLERDPGGVWALRDLFTGLAEGLLAPVVRAIGSLETPDALHALSGLLGRVHLADSILLAEITRLGEVVPHPINEYVLAQVRRHLVSRDPILVRHAMLASGSLEDYEAIPALLEVLDSPDHGLRETARGALRQISDRDFRTSQRAWEHWYGSEVRWWEAEASACFARLDHHDPAVALRAVLEVGNHRIFRHRLAEELGRMLSRHEPEVLILACSTLEQLGSESAVTALLRVMENRNVPVREAAWRALRTITGRDLPLDPAAWATPPS